MECFKLLLEHLAWIEHQFLSGIRDSRKAGSLLGMMGGVEGVRKSEHQSWLAKWRISWITTVVHSLMSVWELYTQLFTRNWRCGRFERSFSQGCSEKIRKKDVVLTAGRWSGWSIQILQFLMLWWPAMKAGSTAMTQRPRDRVPSGSMLALPDPRRSDRANPPTNLWWSLFW